MPNKNLLKIAERLGRENLPKEKTIKKQKIVTPKPTKIDEIFPLEYNTKFTRELITKLNENFKETSIELPMEDNGYVTPHLLNRLGLITTLYNDKNLQSSNLYPITPLESELGLKENKFNPKGTWEDLALILYDTNGTNQKEAKALYKSLQKHQKELGLSKSDLKEKLLIINPGIEKDSDMSHGVKPIILPGLTEVYSSDLLKEQGKHKFEYGLDNGLPNKNELGKGNRILYMPSGSNFGLRVLYRGGGLDLYAWYVLLADSNSGGRVNFARRASR